MHWTAVWEAPRPFLHPVRTPAGAVLTTDAPADHPWHHALWFTIKYVNGENFWEEYGAFGTLRATEVEGRDGAALRATIEWVRPDGETVTLRETRTLTHVELDDHAYAIDWDEQLVAPADTVLDRTPFTTWGGYSGLTLRGAPDWHDTRLLLPDGTPRDRVLGERAPWCALDGLAPLPDGTNAPAGIALLDHSENPRHPTPWYGSTRADTYGEGWANFLNAAFLWDAPLELAAGEALRLRHRVIVHDDVWDTPQVAAAYAQWSTG